MRNWADFFLVYIVQTPGIRISVSLAKGYDLSPHTPKKGVLDMALNSMLCDSKPGDLGSVEYYFFNIIPRSAQIPNGCTCWDPIGGLIISDCRSFVLERKT